MRKTMSLKQIAANRRNAQKSTGPQTPAGRAVSKMNAVKHGILSKEVLVRGMYIKENGREFAALHQRFWEALMPVGPMEEMLVDQIVTTHWRLRRALKADIVGPICESGDCFATDRTVQELGEGEYVAFLSAGAYGHVMAGRYNSRPMPAEVLVRGSSFELVNARESFEQMVAGERVPAWLK